MAAARLSLKPVKRKGFCPMNFDFLQGLLKKKNNPVLFIILLIGIVLMLFSGSRSKPEEKTGMLNEQEELTQLVSKIHGAGKVKVMVTYYGSGTSMIVYDTSTRGDETDRKAVVSGGEAVSSGISYPRVKGVVVVSSGADTENVRQAIIEAVTTALDIPDYKVSVLYGS